MKHTRWPQLRFLVAAGVLVTGALTIAIADDTTGANRTGDIGDTNQVRVATFSSLQPGDDLPPEWEPAHIAGIPQHTEYTLASVDGVTVLRAVADAAMLGLARKVDIPRADAHRITIANRNVPNMVGQISTCLGDAGLNIDDLLNKSRGELAYTIVDLDGEVSPTMLEQLQAIDGVLNVRSLGERPRAA